MPLSYMSYRRAQTGKNGTGGRNFLAPRRACSTHIRVARVSRLIGNSDTTAKICLWQVALWWQGISCGGSRGAEKTLTAGENQPKRQETPPRSERRLGTPAFVTGLPNKRKAVAVSTAPVSGFPTGFSLLRAARWRLLLSGARCCFGSLGILPAAGTSLAFFLYSN
jgi:hypothetical protein